MSASVTTASELPAIAPYRVEASVAVLEGVPLDPGRWRVSVTPKSRDSYIPMKTCETTFPPDLVEFLFEHVNPLWICEVLTRHEGTALASVLERQIFSYFPPSAFVGRRLLDFGCGNGASTFALATLLPHTEIVGLELNESRVFEAKRIAAVRGCPNARFEQSPSGGALPPGIGTFDFVMLSAVFEHLLPQERRTLMPLLWSHIKNGGCVFVNQTPHRYFPYEHHSTELWFINYLPDWLTHRIVRRWGRDKAARAWTWEEHLRGGIRGATEREICCRLTSGDLAAARIRQPTQNGLIDRAACWLSATGPRHRALKRVLAEGFRVCDRLFGTIPSINIDVVIEKIH